MRLRAVDPTQGSDLCGSLNAKDGPRLSYCESEQRAVWSKPPNGNIHMQMQVALSMVDVIIINRGDFEQLAARFPGSYQASKWMGVQILVDGARALSLAARHACWPDQGWRGVPQTGSLPTSLCGAPAQLLLALHACRESECSAGAGAASRLTPGHPCCLIPPQRFLHNVYERSIERARPYFSTSLSAMLSSFDDMRGTGEPSAHRSTLPASLPGPTYPERPPCRPRPCGIRRRCGRS